MSMLQEFKAFAMRGSVVDLAVGVVIGGAFGKIVSSLVEKIIMPPIGMLTGGIDFSQLKWVLKPGDDSDPKHKIAEVAIGYGDFINTVITFLIIAAAIFIVVKAINSLRREQAAAPEAAPAPTKTEALLEDIRDALRAGRP